MCNSTWVQIQDANKNKLNKIPKTMFCIKLVTDLFSKTFYFRPADIY